MSGFFSIESSRLRAEFAAPGTMPNDGCRFSRAGFITEITLDGVHRFCASEPNNLPHPSSHGRGLCSEYQLIGGEGRARYFKPGVGTLEKPADEPYVFYRQYPKRAPEIDVRLEADRAEFVTRQSEGENAIVERRAVRIDPAALSSIISEIELTNCGSAPLELREYCHNFISIDGMALGPDYTLTLPEDFALSPEPGDGIIRVRGNVLTYARYDPAPCMKRVSETFGGRYDAERGGFRWTLANGAAGAGVTGEDRINFDGLAVWAADHIVSAEIFNRISLRPGESCRWSRRLTFFAG